MLQKLIIIFILFSFLRNGYGQEFQLTSPNGRIELSIINNEQISWSATLDGSIVIEKAEIGMQFSNGEVFGTQSALKSHNIKERSNIIRPVVSHKNAAIKDEYKQLVLQFKNDFQLQFRVFNDGVAYQIIDNNKKPRNVELEKLSFTFPEGSTSFFPKEKSTYSHNERYYQNTSLLDISEGEFCSLPVLFNTGNAKVLFTETAVYAYPAMYLEKQKSTSFKAKFPKVVLEAIDAKESSDRNQTITKEADYIAELKGEKSFPWRVFIITNDDKDLIESNLTFQLSRSLAIENTSWIKPGKVAWDWYNANNIYGVDFESGFNTQTYKYYIDFAANNGIEYVILDEGWTKSTTEILAFNPEIDVLELIQYAEKKGVGIILSDISTPL